VANLPEVDQKLYAYFNIIQNDSTKKNL
jgi:hypothetical protein